MISSYLKVNLRYSHFIPLLVIMNGRSVLSGPSELPESIYSPFVGIFIKINVLFFTVRVLRNFQPLFQQNNEYVAPGCACERCLPSAMAISRR